MELATVAHEILVVLHGDGLELTLPAAVVVVVELVVVVRTLVASVDRAGIRGRTGGMRGVCLERALQFRIALMAWIVDRIVQLVLTRRQLFARGLSVRIRNAAVMRGVQLAGHVVLVTDGVLALVRVARLRLGQRRAGCATMLGVVRDGTVANGGAAAARDSRTVLNLVVLVLAAIHRRGRSSDSRCRVPCRGHGVC